MIELTQKIPYERGIKIISPRWASPPNRASSPPYEQPLRRLKVFPVGIYMFKVNNRSTTTICEICSKLITKTPERRLVSVLLTLTRFKTLIWCFHRWLWTSKYRLSYGCKFFHNSWFIEHLNICSCDDRQAFGISSRCTSFAKLKFHVKTFFKMSFDHNNENHIWREQELVETTVVKKNSMHKMLPKLDIWATYSINYNNNII